jgi:predicted permease
MMRKLRALWIRLLGISRQPDSEAEFAAELESDIALHIEDGVRSGLSGEDARRQALIRMGGMEQTRQAYRERRGLPAVETLLQDILYGLRVMAKNPGFTLVAILTLALGIGANTALFSVVNGVLLNPLPYPHPEELVTVHASKPNFNQGSVSYPNFRDWQRDNHTLSALAIARPTSFSLTGLGGSERVRAQFVSSDFFPILGIKPVLGRLFAPGEDEIGRGPVAMIGGGFWQRKFGSKSDVIGKSLTLDGRDYTIVGVLPANFDLSENNFGAREVYVPIGQWQNSVLTDRAAGLGLHGIARIKPGVSFAQAQDDMNHVSDRLAAAFPQDDRGIRARLVPLRASVVGDVQPLLLVLLGAVGFVLLIACVNVANLLLARSNARAQEFAVRAALGATRVRIVRQLLTESTMLALAGGGLGLLLAGWGTRAAISRLPDTLPRASEIHLSAPVFGFTLLVSMTVGILFGLLPALKVSRQRLHDTLKEGGRGASGTRNRTQDSLVVFEMAMALVLLVGAGLMIRSLVALSKVNPGFDAHGVAVFALSAPPSMRNASPVEIRAYLRDAHSHVLHAPGVQAASFFDGGLPMSGEDDEVLFWLDKEAKPTNKNDMHWALKYTTEPDYLKIMRIPLLRGRFFADGDDEHAPLVAVIDEMFAKKFFGNEDAVGRQLNVDEGGDDGQNLKVTVVGVVKHVMQWGLDNDSAVAIPLRAQIYLPYMQQGANQLTFKDGLGEDVLVRSEMADAAVIRGIQSTMQAMNKDQVVTAGKSMDKIVDETLAGQRFSMILLAVFAGIALLLASIGMYGVLSYVVGQRTQEIGVRMALGADRRSVLRWVLGQGGRLAVIGAGVGVAASLLLTQVMARSSLLYGVHAYDPWTMGCVTTLLMLVALAACSVPAWRATRIDPMTALRNE